MPGFGVAFVFWLQFSMVLADLVGIDCERSNDFELVECLPIFDVSTEFCFLPGCDDLACPGLCQVDFDFIISPCPLQYL